MTPKRRAALTATLLTAALALTGCTNSSEGDEQSPEEVLAAAKSVLDETSGVRLTLSADEIPPGVDGILRAEGVGTHDPAFEGDLRVTTGGIELDVPVVAAQGKVFAKLPFTQDFVPVEPTEYGAPDPAGLMEAEGGLSSLLTAAEAVKEGERVRSGEDVLAGYTGTVPGEVVAAIIPSATPDEDFDASFTVDDENRLREAVITGQFYPGSDDVTYTITFDQYDTAADITLP